MFFRAFALVLLVSSGANCQDMEDGIFYLQRSNEPFRCYAVDCQWADSEKYSQECYYEYQKEGKTESGTFYLRDKSALNNPVVEEDGDPVGETISDTYFGTISRAVTVREDRTIVVDCYNRARDLTKEDKAKLNEVCNGLGDVDNDNCPKFRAR